MILKTYPNKNIYGKFFLATEAPDDEDTEVTDEQPKPRRNVKIITVKPSNRSKDFTQVGNDPINEDTTEVDESLDIDNTVYSSEDNTNPDENPSDANAEADEQPDTTAEEQTPETDSPDNTDSETDDTDTGEEGPTFDDNEDFAADDDTGDDNPDNQQTDQQTSNDTTTQPNAPGVELDSMRKYKLYKEYMSLYNACDNYISKLEIILKNNFVENQIILTAVSNLREIKDILFDYMSIRFQLNTYVQSLLFYQKMVVAVQLVFKLLKFINPDK